MSKGTASFFTSFWLIVATVLGLTSNLIMISESPGRGVGYYLAAVGSLILAFLFYRQIK